MRQQLEIEIEALFDQWNQALQSKDPKTVSSLYHSDSILLPTLSNQVRHNHEEIENYFIHFLATGPVGSILESNVRVFDDLAINSGIYSFSFEDGSSAEARYTFVYRQVEDVWKIVEHHSSLLPE